MENSDMKKKLENILNHKKKKRLSIDDILETFSNFELKNDENDLDNKNHKREQVKNACINCKIAHKKCTPNRPCNRCSEFNIAELCKDSTRKPRKKNNKNTENNKYNSI
jgi:hypothetical protein